MEYSTIVDDTLAVAFRHGTPVPDVRIDSMDAHPQIRQGRLWLERVTP